MAKKQKKSDVLVISSKEAVEAYYNHYGPKMRITGDMLMEMPDNPTPTNDGDLKDLEKTR